MSRPVRIEYPGAVYHVICRGNNRQAISRDEQDRIRYLEKLCFYCQDKSVDLQLKADTHVTALRNRNLLILDPATS